MQVKLSRGVERFQQATRRGTAPWLLLGASLLAGPLIARAAADHDEALGRKIAAYVYCINDQTGAVMRSRKFYFQWLESPAKGPTGQEAAITLGGAQVLALDDTQRCLDRIEQAKQLPPSIPDLEHTAARFAETLSAADTLLRKAHEYYALGNYQDDRLREGKAMHPQLLELYSNFGKASDQLYDQVVAVQDAIAERRMAKLAQDPQMRGEFLIAQIVARAKHTIDLADGLGDEDFVAKPFEDAVDALEQAWREIDEYGKANPKHHNSGIRHASLAKSAFDLLKSARAAQRRQRNGFRFNDSDTVLIQANAPQLVDGHPAQLIAKYNAVVDAANSARR